ncbi:DUF438 domain-containing protein, partial [Candidatus Woesearchaeota archaeon]|nr:DUF438 domain-containing protein [Candidatus Woesearchaeota archaeon]
MGTIKNLDLRKMPPFERHTKIFEMWNSLKQGETLRITNDHAPKPLYYLFEAEHNGEFEWKYEKEGPRDWVFAIKKIIEKNTSDKKQQIKELIKKLRTEDDIAALKEEGKELLKNISPKDLAMIEQEIIQEGTTRKEMRKLCDAHLEVMKEGLKGINMKLKPGHPIHTLMEEHKMIIEFVNKLKDTIKRLESKKSYEEASEDVAMLIHIAEHLVEADKHHQREEEALFPEIEKAGMTEPPLIMREEHEELKPKKVELYKIAKENKKLPYKEFVKKAKETAQYIIKELPDHIYKEDNILYPLAIETIPKEKWAAIKKKCDKIGYC